MRHDEGRQLPHPYELSEPEPSGSLSSRSVASPSFPLPELLGRVPLRSLPVLSTAVGGLTFSHGR